jgi:uncharacterized protein
MTEAKGRGPVRLLTLPGWLSSGAGHWQTRWEQDHAFERVEQADWQWPRRGDWIARLEDTLLADPRPALLAAHSLGCHLVAAWAAHTQLPDRVCGALLVAPPDLERADLAPQLCGWRPTVRHPLHLPALLAYSDDDPFSSADATRRLAADWNVPTWALGARGHLNAASGLGDWPEALARLQHLTPTPP